MDDAAVPLCHVSPPLAAIHLNGVEEARVRLEAVWDHRPGVQSEWMETRSDPRRRRNVAQPPEIRSPGERGGSVLAELDHARRLLSTEDPQAQPHSYRSALSADMRIARRAGRNPASSATPSASASAPSASSGPTTKIAAGFVPGFSCRMMRSMI
jgi:hypothetical protein